MIRIRKSKDRGHLNHGWLDTYHTFSFGDYRDPAYMGFRTLRVINEDRVERGAGFAPHSHRDMEIITYILDGALQHKDSMGNTSVIKAGEVQRMSAGTGVTHSEFNASQKDSVHLLQIWILPRTKSITPGYEQKMYDAKGKKNRLRLIVSPDGKEGSLKIHQEASVYDCHLERGNTIEHAFPNTGGAWLQMIKGDIKLDAHHLSDGDGASIEGEKTLHLTAGIDSDFLLFDLN